MTRERWMLGAIAFVVLLLVASGLVLIVSGDDNQNVSVSATTTSSTTTSSTTTTTLASGTTTTTGSTSVTTGGICATPDEAAKALVESWIAGNQVAAARCATPAAVSTIFQTSGAGAQYTFQGCIGEDPAAKQCGYTYEGGAVILQVTGSAAAGWQVQSLSSLAD